MGAAGAGENGGDKVNRKIRIDPGMAVGYLELNDSWRWSCRHCGAVEGGGVLRHRETCVILALEAQNRTR
jgi:hypothetical protein